jgi:hypothetical protein
LFFVVCLITGTKLSAEHEANMKKEQCGNIFKKIPRKKRGKAAGGNRSGA